jgi:5-formyltetrahydrofolate cyclo-ligase
MMNDWDEIRKWRRAMRAELLSRRLAVPRAEKPGVRSVLHDLIREQFPELRHACIGFYWPFRGEIDFRHLVRDFLALGAEAALPVVVEKQRPLEFWAWRPRMKLARGFWNIPVPAERNPVQPTALLVPLVGFDAAGYRLGFGGGYYDRTLAALDPKPLTIGVGYEFGRLKTIYPQPHDIPLDAIVTEAGCARFRYRGETLGAPRRPGETANHHGDEKLDEALKGTFPASEPHHLDHEDVSSYASPPCFMHELDPEYLGFSSTADTIALLNQLLEGERAGARAVSEMAKLAADVPDRATLREIAMDEARFCAMLTRHITRLGGTPSLQTGAFYGKLMALAGSRERIDLLNRGQDWVVRKLREALPGIGDRALRNDLQDMLEVHERNIRRGKGLL